MHGLLLLLVICAVGAIVSGPIALIISIIALKNSTRVLEQLQKQERLTRQQAAFKPQTIFEKKPEVEKKIPLPESEQQAKQVYTEKKKAALEAIAVGGIDMDEKKDKNYSKTNVLVSDVKADKNALEEIIGTRWVLFAGIVAVIFAVGFFLKYAYDNNLIGPRGRVIIVVIAGFITLAIGEITRRRGYGIVAKSVTALGLAILYSAVFAAYAYYGLITSSYAYVFSMLITTAAMIYAVSLDEIAAAFLSLLGGFLTPVLISTGKNLPVPLFTYVLILDAGALFCAYYRKWRLVNIVSFIGTFALYTGWFEQFYRPEVRAAQGMPSQMPVALTWLAIFFIVYLILPVLHDLLRKIEAQKEDVFLVVANAAVIFYYLWSIMFRNYRTELSFTTLGLCTVHLGMMLLVIKRCGFDLNLRLAYLAIALFFLTITIPLYLKLYAIAIAWAIEAAVLIAIGLRYKSTWTQVGGVIALSLSFGQLMNQMPMHSNTFELVFNTSFGSWCAVCAAIIVCHILYRTTHNLIEEQRDLISQSSYAIAALFLLAAIVLEWYYNYKLNISDQNIGEEIFYKGIVIIAALFPPLLLVRPVCPRGIICKMLAVIIAIAGSIEAIVNFRLFYRSDFTIFANLEFIIVLFFVTILFVDAWLLYKFHKNEQFGYELIITFILAAIVVLWVLITEEIYLYWYCKNKFSHGVENWNFLAHMYISVMWALYGAALMAAGFWRKNAVLRYMSLGLFGLLLLKVFILDTSKMENVYRIAAFLATGVTLVAVSYLYQFLKKKGFFDNILSE